MWHSLEPVFRAVEICRCPREETGVHAVRLWESPGFASVPEAFAQAT